MIDEVTAEMMVMDYMDARDDPGRLVPWLRWLRVQPEHRGVRRSERWPDVFIGPTGVGIYVGGGRWVEEMGDCEGLRRALEIYDAQMAEWGYALAKETALKAVGEVPMLQDGTLDAMLRQRWRECVLWKRTGIGDMIVFEARKRACKGADSVQDRTSADENEHKIADFALAMDQIFTALFLSPDPSWSSPRP